MYTRINQHAKRALTEHSILIRKQIQTEINLIFNDLNLVLELSKYWHVNEISQNMNAKIKNNSHDPKYKIIRANSIVGEHSKTNYNEVIEEIFLTRLYELVATQYVEFRYFLNGYTELRLKNHSNKTKNEDNYKYDKTFEEKCYYYMYAYNEKEFRRLNCYETIHSDIIDCVLNGSILC